MSDLLWHSRGEQCVAIQLPHDHSAMLAGWAAIRSRMVRSMHPDFTRSEWAYLIQFLDPHHLQSTFDNSFGPASSPAIARSLLVPQKKIALWLPNNVSLLGPLTVILLSLVGSQVRIKTGSRSRDLCASLLQWLRKESPAGALQDWLQNGVTVNSFDRYDPRNAEMAAWADARILFGGDEAAAAIERLPHPYMSQGFYFAHKVSEAWIDASRINVALATELGKVFGIYGQAGCTSPKRVVVIDGTKQKALEMANLLASTWGKTNPDPQPRHVASETAMAIQWGKALGLEIVALGQNSGLAMVGPAAPLPLEAHMAIAIQWGTLAETLATQPSHLQTIGHALALASDPKWLHALAASPAIRFIPLGRMHHFGPVWDGVPWWRNLFREHALEVGE